MPMFGLRYRQNGTPNALLDAPYENERSSSSRLLPQFAVRKMFSIAIERACFEKWGKYLRTRTLSNRSDSIPRDQRQLQCAQLTCFISACWLSMAQRLSMFGSA